METVDQVLSLWFAATWASALFPGDAPGISGELTGIYPSPWPSRSARSIYLFQRKRSAAEYGYANGCGSAAAG